MSSVNNFSLAELKQLGAETITNLSYPSFEDVYDVVGAEEVLDEMLDSGRWSITHRVVLKIDDRFYSFTYSEPATEMQEWDPWTMKEEWKGLQEVRPQEVTVIKYVPV